MKQLSKFIKLVIATLSVFCLFGFSHSVPLQKYKQALSITSDSMERVHISKSLDLIYPGQSGPVKYDLYYPVDYLKKKYPIFIWIHGGGFWAGSRSDGMDVAIASAIAELGYVVANIDYTLVSIGKPETAFPAAMNDIEKFISFARQNLNTVNADLNTSINIGGASAGAFLALHQATNPKSDLPFRCVVDAFGPTDASDPLMRPGSTRIANVAYTASDTVIPSLELKRSLSPLYRLGNFQGTVAMILHSNKDTLVPFHHSIWLENALKNMNISVITNYIPSQSMSVGEQDHDYPIDRLIDDLQSVLSTQTCKNVTVSLSCTQNVKRGGTINCLSFLNVNKMRDFYWLVNGQKDNMSVRKMSYSWANITPGKYSAQIVAEDMQGQIHHSNVVQVEIK